MKKITTIRISASIWRKQVALAALVLTAFGACKKDSDEAPSPASTATKTEMLTSKAWKLTASTVSPAIMGMTDLYAVMASCELDNTIKFNADATKSLVQDEGASKCNSMDPQQMTGTWQLNTAETEVVVNLNSQTETYTLQNISANSLRVSYTTVINGSMYTMTDTYSNQ